MAQKGPPRPASTSAFPSSLLRRHLVEVVLNGETKQSAVLTAHLLKKKEGPQNIELAIRHSCHPIPLWEREFCIYVGGISWQRFYKNKKYVSMYKNIEQWDDSEAFDNFKNAKARFWAKYHGQPLDIPLSDPNMYIDKVDHNLQDQP
uniref:Hypothetical_protein n=1 Tax=Oryza brachyantha TaxID=4533 RepID=G2XMD4_ORYBR|nr:hypothetical_protein [Oryza brachyantha]